VSFIVSGALLVSGKNFSPPGGTITFHNGAVINNSGGTLVFQGITIGNTAAVSGSGDFSAAGNFTINIGATYSPAATQIISGGGTLTGSGTVKVTRTLSVADFSTQYNINNNLTNLIVEYSAASAQTVSTLTYGYLTISTTGSAIATLANDTIVGKTLTINSSGILSLGGHQLTVGGNWTNFGSFNHDSGTVVFNDNLQTSTISGANTFYNFTCTTTDKTLQFSNGITQNMVASSGFLRINGQSGHNIIIKSDSTGNKWFINHQGDESVTYAKVTDSGCNGSTEILVTNGDQSDDNNEACWVFGAEPTPTPTPTPTETPIPVPGGADFNFNGNFNFNGINLN
jgi:hypothetical protein